MAYLPSFSSFPYLTLKDIRKSTINKKVYALTAEHINSHKCHLMLFSMASKIINAWITYYIYQYLNSIQNLTSWVPCFHNNTQSLNFILKTLFSESTLTMKLCSTWERLKYGSSTVQKLTKISNYIQLSWYTITLIKYQTIKSLMFTRHQHWPNK